MLVERLGNALRFIALLAIAKPLSKVGAVGQSKIYPSFPVSELREDMQLGILHFK